MVSKISKFRTNLGLNCLCDNQSCCFFFFFFNLLGGQFWNIDRFNLLGAEWAK